VSSVDEQGRLHHLVRCPNETRWCGEVESLAWSENGRWLAVSVTSFGAANPYNGINVFDLKLGTDSLIRRCAPPECDWFDLHWSGDGTRLSYVTGGRIYLIRRSGVGGARMLKTGLSGILSSPSWSPDGSRVAFAARLTKKASSLIYSIRPDGTRLHLLAREASEPAWSPDGTRIAVTSSCGNAIKLLTPTGRDVTPGVGRCRTIGVSGAPAWSPNGSQLAIVSTRGNPIYRRPGVYVCDIDGSNLRLLTKTVPRGVTGRPGLSWQPRLAP
jgi:Tol biopolymer transport system component